MTHKAIIYCRVSSERQVNEGHGLDGQEMRGRSVATSRSCIVAEVFRDEGVSGKESDRPGLLALFKYLEENALFGDPMYVIIDDISRLARDVEVHFQIRAKIKILNGILLCGSQQLDDEDPYAKFNETIMAGAAELHRSENRLRVIKNMRSRLEAGLASTPFLRHIARS